MIRVLGLLAALLVGSAQAATLLPNGKQQFFGLNGQPLVSGTVATYVPGTVTPKTTWQDSGGTVPNTNPIVLDSLGSAIIYGAGCYRQQVRDSLANLVWDQLTCDTSVAGGIIWAGQSSGSPNSIIVNAPSFTGTDGQQIAFMALNTNTGPVTIDAGTGPIPLVKDTPSGNTALVSGDLVAGNIYNVWYSVITSSFHTTLLASAVAAATPVGVILDWVGNSSAVPAGWLLADGTCYNQVTYANLYAVIGLNYGSYCPSGQFPVPDTRGRVMAGMDTSPSTGTASRLTGSTGFGCGNAAATCSIAGTEGFTLVTGQLPVTTITPTGTVTVDFHTTATYNESIYGSGGAGTGSATTVTAGTSPQPVTGVGPTSFGLSMNSVSFGSGSTIYHVQPTMMANKIIKY